MGRLKFLTAGESHGKCLVGILEGVPAGLELSADDFERDLSKRSLGIGRSSRMKVEKSGVEILSGVRLGKTTGAPIAVRIENMVHDKWADVVKIEKGEGGSKPITTPRPGHADYAGFGKFRLDDIRDVIERASARETAVRCALGAIARKFLAALKIEIMSRPLVIGDVHFDYEIPFPTSQDLPDGLESLETEAEEKYCNEKQKELENLEKSLEETGDTTGGIFQIIASGLPVGLGSYTQADKRLDALLGYSIMSIPSVKGFAIGAIMVSDFHHGLSYMDGFTKHQDEFLSRSTNNAGGIEGGITNGQPIILSGCVKPVPTTKTPQKSFDLASMKEKDSFYENADLWVVEAAGVIAEGMTAIVIMDAVLDKFGGDSLSETKERFPF